MKTSVEWLKEYSNIKIEQLDLTNYQDLPILPTTIEGTLCVCPTTYYEGFFVSKLTKTRE